MNVKTPFKNHYTTFVFQLLTICLIVFHSVSLASCSDKDRKISGGDRPPPVIKGQDPVESEHVTVSGAITKVPR